MKVLEEYAIECSIAKVYGSEVLYYVIDEAVQIFGGYGFHEDYPVARAYRDTRVDRIFEGTNEINRLLIIQMLMKRALGGTLPLLAAGAKLQEEILRGPSFEEAPEGPWARRRAHRCRQRRKLSAGCRRGHAEIPREACRPAGDRRGARRYRDRNFRDGVRADPRAKGRGVTRRQRRPQPCFRRCASAAARRRGTDRERARAALAASVEGDMLRTQLAVLRRFAKREPADMIALRRRSPTPCSPPIATRSKGNAALEIRVQYLLPSPAMEGRNCARRTGFYYPSPGLSAPLYHG